jgi:hypothetical protein
VGAGPLTGSLERPSQGAQENRKAANRKDIDTRRSERDAVRSARAALVGLHRAEMQIMVARHGAERRHVVEAARASASALRAATTEAITAKYAERLARIFDSGDARCAWSARERLKLEEAIEMAQAMLAVGRATAESRRSMLAALRITHRAERGGLAERQRRQRAVLAVLLGRLRRASREPPQGARAAAYRSRPSARPWLSGPRGSGR